MTIFIVLLSIRGYRLYQDLANEKSRKEIEEVYAQTVEEINLIEKQPDTAEKQEIPKSKNGIIGKIEIPKIDVSYVILDETTDKNLDISITKVTGPSINEKGNLVLAGHNMKNDTLFGKLDQMKRNDSIILYDLAGEAYEFKVTNTTIVHETDLSALAQDQVDAEYITLITCTSKDDERLIVYGQKI